MSFAHLTPLFATVREDFSLTKSPSAAKSGVPRVPPNQSRIKEKSKSDGKRDDPESPRDPGIVFHSPNQSESQNVAKRPGHQKDSRAARRSMRRKLRLHGDLNP